MAAKQQLRKFIEKALLDHAERNDLANNQSLFVIGRLNSFTMLNLIMYLEQTFGVDLSCENSEVELIDSVDAIESLVDSQTVK